jgi:hypothetical protein
MASIYTLGSGGLFLIIIMILGPLYYLGETVKEAREAWRRYKGIGGRGRRVSKPKESTYGVRGERSSIAKWRLSADRYLEIKPVRDILRKYSRDDDAVMEASIKIIDTLKKYGLLSSDAFSRRREKIRRIIRDTIRDKVGISDEDRLRKLVNKIYRVLMKKYGGSF